MYTSSGWYFNGLSLHRSGASPEASSCAASDGFGTSWGCQASTAASSPAKEHERGVYQLVQRYLLACTCSQLTVALMARLVSGRQLPA